MQQAGRWDREQVQVLLSEAVGTATASLPQTIEERHGTYGLEEDLRGGIARALRDRGELVVTEAKIGIPDWSAKVGGFDLALVSDKGQLVIAETKWADGKLYESIWDLLKLANAQTMTRVLSAFAIYAAPLRHWEKRVATADLFEPGIYDSVDLIAAFAGKWAKMLKTNNAWPRGVPVDFTTAPIAAFQTFVLGVPWEVRIVEVVAGDIWTWLEDGWPPSVTRD
jgi:hypothetical protein